MNIKKLLAKIKKIRPDLLKTLEETAEVCRQLSLFESLYTLDKLETFLTSATPENLAAGIRDFLLLRGQRAAHRYTQEPEDPVNRLCQKLAIALSPLPAGEEAINELPLGEGPYFLLMPNLKAHQDATGENIHQLTLNEFVLSDKEDLFIPLELCFDHAINSDEGNFGQVVSFKNEYPLLTPTELLRVSQHSVHAQEYYGAVVTYNNSRLHGIGLGPELARLVIALRTGGVDRQGQKGGGTELDSGSAANEGIVAFNEYWNTVSAKQKQLFYQQYPTLEELIDRLMRPTHTNYKESQFCVQLIAIAIDPIITRYKRSKDGLNAHQAVTKTLTQKKLAFLTQVKTKNYPHLPITKQEPKFLRWFFALEESPKNKISNIPTHQGVLHYVLEHEFSSLPSFIDLLPEQLIRQDILAAKSKNQDTVLIIAAAQGNEELVRLILDLGADINAKNIHLWTALHSAVFNGHEQVAAILLEKGAKFDNEGFCLLHHAISCRYNNIAQALINKGVNLNYRDTNGNNALDIAITQRSRLIKPLLIKAMKLPLADQTELLLRQGKENSSVLLYMAEKHPTIFLNLLAEAEQHDTEFMPNLLALRNKEGQNLLMLTAEAGNEETVKLLLKLGVNINELDNNKLSALMTAVSYGQNGVVKILLENGANLFEKEGQFSKYILQIAKNRKFLLVIATILLKALTLPPLEQLKFMSKWTNYLHPEEGFNYAGVRHNMSLWKYAVSEHPEILHILLAGINPQQVPDLLEPINRHGETALLKAVEVRNSEAALKLIELGCDVDTTNHSCEFGSNLTPLHLAIHHGDKPLIISLLKNGANITRTYLVHKSYLEYDDSLVKNALDLIVSEIKRQPDNTDLKEIFVHFLLKAITLTLEQQKGLFLHHKLEFGDDSYGGLYYKRRYENVWIYTAEKFPALFDILLHKAQEQGIPIPTVVFNQRSPDGQTLLSLTAKAGNRKTFLSLLRIGGDNIVTFTQEILNFALKVGNHDILATLLKKGAYTKCYDNSVLNSLTPHTPLEAVKIILFEAIKLTLEEQQLSFATYIGSTRVRAYNNIWIYTAENYPALLDSLLDKAQEQNIAIPTEVLYPANKTEASLLILATKALNLKAVTKLLELEASVNTLDQSGYGAIHYAISLKNTSLIEALLKKAPHLLLQKNAAGEQALDLAIKNQPNLIHFLLHNAITVPFEIQMKLITKTTKKNILMLVVEFYPDLILPLLAAMEKLPQEQARITELFSATDANGKTIWDYAVQESPKMTVALLNFAQKLTIPIVNLVSVLRTIQLNQLQNIEHMVLVLQLRAFTEIHNKKIYAPFSPAEKHALKTAEFSAANWHTIITEGLLPVSQVRCTKEDMYQYLTQTIPEGEVRKTAISAVLNGDTPLKRYFATTRLGLFTRKSDIFLSQLQKELSRLETISTPDAATPEVPTTTPDVPAATDSTSTSAASTLQTSSSYKYDVV